MWWKKCALLAASLMVLSGLNLLMILYLQFVFPRTVQQWAEEGRALSVWQRWMVQASDICINHGVVLLMILGLLLVISTSWWRAIRKLRALEARFDRDL